MLETKGIRWNTKLKLIDPDDIHPDEGLEHDPHVTVLFGIHEDHANPEAVIRTLQQVKPIKITVKEISIFEGDEYDVVKYTIPKVPTLLKARRLLMAKFDHTVTFPDYCPHMTIGYVKKGMGQKYVGSVDPFDVTFGTALYSFHHIPGDKSTRDQIRQAL